ncbi:hypothetical protein KBD69_02920 [Candidatus Woesebacteria bacterium]|nr:hypothetical protein [Candidatus Woesebacteria bacterium]
MQKKYTFLSLLTILATFTFVLTSASAASPSPSPKVSASPSPSPSPISDETVTENIKKRLQESLSGDAEAQDVNYKSFVGVIRDVIKDTLVIEDKDGKKKIVIKDDASIVRSPGNKTIPVDSIRIDDYIISIGTLKESDELEAVRIIVSADPLTATSKTSALARITKISKNAITTSSVATGETKVINLTTKTALKSSLGESMEATDLSVGDSIIYTATLSKDVLTVTSLMRIGFADAPQEQ